MVLINDKTVVSLCEVNYFICNALYVGRPLWLLAHVPLFIDLVMLDWRWYPACSDACVQHSPAFGTLDVTPPKLAGLLKQGIVCANFQAIISIAALHSLTRPPSRLDSFNV